MMRVLGSRVKTRGKPETEEIQLPFARSITSHDA
jgi:hypothetical protein